VTPEFWCQHAHLWLHRCIMCHGSKNMSTSSLSQPALHCMVCDASPLCCPVLTHRHAPAPSFLQL
jgi:hypothetical protein